MRARRRSQGVKLYPQAQAWLRDDIPEAVKIKLRLALRGSRVPRRCLLCGRTPAPHRGVWVCDMDLRVGATTIQSKCYALCTRCLYTASPEAIHTRLYPPEGRGVQGETMDGAQSNTVIIEVTAGSAAPEDVADKHTSLSVPEDHR